MTDKKNREYRCRSLGINDETGAWALENRRPLCLGAGNTLHMMHQLARDPSSPQIIPQHSCLVASTAGAVTISCKSARPAVLWHIMAQYTYINFLS